MNMSESSICQFVLKMKKNGNVKSKHQVLFFLTQLGSLVGPQPCNTGEATHPGVSGTRFEEDLMTM